MKKTTKKRVYRITRADVDKRLDSVLITLLKKDPQKSRSLSRADLTSMMKRGVITVNSEIVKTHYLVRLGDIIEMPERALQEKQYSFPSTTKLSLEVIFENDFFLVINKPAGLLVHPTGHSEEETVVHWLLARSPHLADIGEDPLRPGIVHRLDRETSGILLIAKTPDAFGALKQVFQKRQVEKTYLALLYGHLSLLKGKSEAAMTRASGDLKRALVHKETGQKTWEAVTRYAVVRRYRDYDLVQAHPKTGRTHQIRLHFSGLGHPVVGDKLYAYRAQRQDAALPSTRQLLHALALSFDFEGQRFAFGAPLPADFRNFLRDIDETLEEGYDDEALKGLL